ncbi:Sec-independent protein translocase protein TatB [Acinetobacter sp. WU_MDCI_Abxc22]|uniref:Sec-independent protein translocase protein TatB n=1 Tax=Acinetobacter sp. WU_MDCI_Abxc22 TaxID=2850071 RepID=UPI0021CD4681|nr:Sec-independent protein translocase protein TatB [Acinetobacter sp. WU_MDCI_Abxc22]MCU4361577.1 Sec-independent protein translocase protein TatB [Acinetobacter sp. WU_MDCI_Abxc22]
MFGFGFSEFLFFVVIAIVVLGPERLPLVFKQGIRWFHKWIKFKSDIQNMLERELEISTLKNELNKELVSVRALEKQLENYLNKVHLSVLRTEKNARDNTYYLIEDILLILPYQVRFAVYHSSQWSCFYGVKKE